MELRHLRYFVTLAEELHFKRAADRLHIAQPPLSQQIRQLETELGFQLFHRTKRNVQLTEAGQAFLAESRLILRQLEQAIEAGRQISRGEMGQLAIGFIASAAYNVLPEILRQFRNTVPGVKLQLHEFTTEQQLQWLGENRIDIGFVRPPIEQNTLSSEIIFQEPFVIALSQKHKLADRSEISISQLAGEPFILFPRSQALVLYDQIISFCQQSEFSPNVVQEAIQMQTIVSLVAAEIGIAIVPASVQNLQRTGVVYKPIKEVSPVVEIAIAWRTNDTSPTVRRFLQMLENFNHRCRR